jgi:hypothetical protein
MVAVAIGSARILVRRQSESRAVLHNIPHSPPSFRLATSWRFPLFRFTIHHDRQSSHSSHAFLFGCSSDTTSYRRLQSRTLMTIATPTSTRVDSHRQISVLGRVEVRSGEKPKDMVLTRQRTSPRDPDKFPAAQLFLLGTVFTLAPFNGEKR